MATLPKNCLPDLVAEAGRGFWEAADGRHGGRRRDEEQHQLLQRLLLHVYLFGDCDVASCRLSVVDGNWWLRFCPVISEWRADILRSGLIYFCFVHRLTELQEKLGCVNSLLIIVPKINTVAPKRVCA